MNGIQLQYLVPPGFISARPVFKREIFELGASIRGADSSRGARVPGTPLTIRLLLMLNGAGIEFDYHEELAYINFCCFQRKYSDDIFEIVGHYYNRHGLGAPSKPTFDQWIHLVPVAGPMPNLKYSFLSQELAASFYYAAYMQHLERNHLMSNTGERR